MYARMIPGLEPVEGVKTRSIFVIRCTKQGCFVRSLELQITVVLSAAPRQIDRGDVQWHYEENTEAVPV